MSPNGVRLPAAATFPDPLVDVTFFSKLVISTPPALRCWCGVADTSICIAKKGMKKWLNILTMNYVPVCLVEQKVV